MGRHSRRGPAPKGDPAAAGERGPDSGTARSGPEARRATPGLPGQRQAPPDGARFDVPGSQGGGAQGQTQVGVRRQGRPGADRPAQAPRAPQPQPPRLPDGTPARGVPGLPDGTPGRGTPHVRGAHPELREAGGGWGEFAGAAAGERQGPRLPRQRRAVGPRQDYLDAFDEKFSDQDVTHHKASDQNLSARNLSARNLSDQNLSDRDVRDRGTLGPDVLDLDVDVFVPRARTSRADAVRPYPPAAAPHGAPADGAAPQKGGAKGRAFTGVVAAAVTTVLAVIVAGQVADGRHDTAVRSRSVPEQASDARTAVPSAAPGAVTLTYEQKMDTTYPLSATLKASGKFDVVPGFDKAPGKGQKYTYRVDVEQGLGLDGGLFAEAVQKTLNDDRSWAHHGAKTFERVSTGKPDFVITLASPGTTAQWCAKSGLDTTEDNVSCDSAATERVMINAYRWAQGSKTYGDKIHAYRQMLINHEVGHRLGHGHVTCDKNGEPAPVMQQQTKFLDHDGIHCLPNPWPFPTS
ncbi:DUF3152 domain-containing protein [Streptomyces sp. NPDC006739]|uniref:DUF3152 domain-containing protein n=1 Tax=Streptomyces sp. NPDC006739 TaxID=3364763 RepID=UPI003678268D